MGEITMDLNNSEIEAKVNSCIHKTHLVLKHIRGIKAYLQEDNKIQFLLSEEGSQKLNEKRGNNMKIILNAACKKSVRMQLTIYLKVKKL